MMTDADQLCSALENAPAGSVGVATKTEVSIPKVCGREAVLVFGLSFGHFMENHHW
jgi:hypothetical protein